MVQSRKIMDYSVESRKIMEKGTSGDLEIFWKYFKCLGAKTLP